MNNIKFVGQPTNAMPLKDVNNEHTKVNKPSQWEKEVKVQEISYSGNRKFLLTLFSLQSDQSII